jgi:hypothetical protein
MFEINIYEVTQSTPHTLMRDTKTAGNYTLEPNATEVEITLPDKNPIDLSTRSIISHYLSAISC